MSTPSSITDPRKDRRRHRAPEQPMTFRTILFWMHLTAGVIAGTVILVMSATGTLLTFQQSVLRLVERSQRVVQVPAGQARLPLDEIVANVKRALPGAEPATVTVDADPAVSVAVAIGAPGTAFVNPYTGEVLGTGSARARGFYRTVTNWHRYLALSGDQRTTGRALTGASNAAFLVLALSGLYLWWPRQFTWRHVRPIAWFRGGLRGKARDFNWHNAIGLWSAPVLIVLTATGMVISYPWASNLVYDLAGSPRPVAAGRGGGPGGRGDEGGRGGRGGRDGGAPEGRQGVVGSSAVTREARSESTEASAGGTRGPRSASAIARTEGAGGGREPRTGSADSRAGGPDSLRDTATGPGASSDRLGSVPNATLDALMQRAQAQVPTWSVIALRLPPRNGGPAAATITDGAHWNRFARSTLTLDGRSGAAVRWEPYMAMSAGQKLRGWMRFAHTGELGGPVGEAVAGLACLGGVFLVYTGVALSLRRLAAWRRRVGARARVAAPVDA